MSRREWGLAIAVIVTMLALGVVLEFFAPRPTITHVVRTKTAVPKYFVIPEVTPPHGHVGVPTWQP